METIRLLIAFLLVQALSRLDRNLTYRVDASVEDQHALTDVRSLLLQVWVTAPEALQELCVHVLPADLNGHVELHTNIPGYAE